MMLTPWRLLLLVAALTSTTAPAIIGGLEKGPSDSRVASAMVALQMTELQADGSTHYYKGSAVLIGPDLLLTAAHNVAYIPDPSNVVAIFSATPCWGENTCQETRIVASKTVTHPLFRQITGGTEFDIAIVKLNATPPASYRRLGLLTLPSADNHISVWGFGTDRQNTHVPLAAFRLRVIEDRWLDRDSQVGLHQKFWVDQSDGGFCNGDSGGPALVQEGLVAGVAIHVTYNNGIGDCLTKGAFTDVLYFREWIVSTLKDLS